MKTATRAGYTLGVRSPRISNRGTPRPSMVDEEMGMPAKRELSMRQLRHLLRLHHGGVSAREIGRRLGVARSTVQDNLKRAAAAGVGGGARGRDDARSPGGGRC